MKHKKPMTLEEAIHNLEVDEKFCQASGSRSCEEFKIAISCIEKQIAKKPTDIGWTYCPTCNNELDPISKNEYCKCGQKINWE